MLQPHYSSSNAIARSPFKAAKRNNNVSRNNRAQQIELTD